MIRSLIALSILACSACAVNAQDHGKASPLSDYLDTSYTVDNRIIIGPQPPEDALGEFTNGDIATVINFRSTPEIKGMGFDQSALLDAAGVDYHHIGIGGDESYSPEKLEQFNAAMEAAGTDHILLHCRSGHRASQMYAAWLVKYRGLSPDQALERVAPSGWWPMPMEQLLGQPLSVSVQEG